MVMAKSLFWLSDEAWKALSPHLPRGRPGKPRVDDRTVISGILHVLKTGCRWRDVPLISWAADNDLQPLQSLV
jgi:transposase